MYSRSQKIGEPCAGMTKQACMTWLAGKLAKWMGHFTLGKSQRWCLQRNEKTATLLASQSNKPVMSYLCKAAQFSMLFNRPIITCNSPHCPIWMNLHSAILHTFSTVTILQKAGCSVWIQDAKILLIISCTCKVELESWTEISKQLMHEQDLTHRKSLLQHAEQGVCPCSLGRMWTSDKGSWPSSTMLCYIDYVLTM